MGSAATDHAIFETFYKDVRGRLLLQTWALTGDLPAAQKAVRDALVIAWHHWRKVRRLDAVDREDWVRPLAWGRAQRRHSVPHLHRTKGLDGEVKETLNALGKLSITQRKVLLLAHLSSVSLEQLAREVGITGVRAERELQTAAAAFSQTRGVAPTEILPLFEPMAAIVATQRWPRPTILTRAGSTRRRTHTLVGAAAAVAALAGSGVFVAHSGDVSPRLESLSLHSTESTGPTAPSAGSTTLSPQDLLDPDEVGTQLGGAWTTEITSDSTRGSGMVLPCQRARFGQSAGSLALLRSFTGPGKKLVADQAAEIAATPSAAAASYQRALGWYAGCTAPRTQLLSTQRLTGVGDDAMVFSLRDWTDPARSIAIGVARSGRFTTSVATTTDATGARAVPRAADLLGTAVGHLCTLPGHGACATGRVIRTDVPPLAVGRNPGLLGGYDLPPVTGVTSPWVATPAEKVKTNLAATRCDQTSFTGKGIAGARTRTFVIPDATNVSAAFGLTETVGRLPTQKAAAGFVETIRKQLASCGDRQLGSHVTPLAGGTSTKTREVFVWRVRVETSKTDSVVYLMAAVRQGNAVAQLGFVPSDKVVMDPSDFQALADRAADRLALL